MRRITALLAFVLLFAATPARADWYRAESPRFIVYGEIPQERLRERIALLEQFDAALRVLTGTTAAPAPQKLRVYLVHGIFELDDVWPVRTGIGGFYRASPEGVLIVVDESRNWRDNRNDTLFHEYAHHFMMQYHPAPYPLWYVEGFADFVMSAVIRPGTVEFGSPNSVQGRWLSGRGRWTPYADLLAGDLRILAGTYYAQSWLLVHFIMTDEARRAAFTRYVEAVGRGAVPLPAFTTAFGMDAAALDRAIRHYARRLPEQRLDLPQQAPPPIRVTRLDAAPINPPLIEAALLLDLPPARGRRLLGLARRAGRGAGTFGARLQARAEIVLGDPAAADRLLDGMLAAAPDDAELLYLKGLRHLVAGRRDARVRASEYRLAGEYFAGALRADPNHYPSLFRSAEARSAGHEFLTDDTQRRLQLAASLAPQVSEIRLATAHFLLLRGRFEQAEALVLPLLTSVHPPDAERSAELLRLARTGERPRDPIVFEVAAAPAAR